MGLGHLRSWAHENHEKRRRSQRAAGRCRRGHPRCLCRPDLALPEGPRQSCPSLSQAGRLASCMGTVRGVSCCTSRSALPGPCRSLAGSAGECPRRTSGTSRRALLAGPPSSGRGRNPDPSLLPLGCPRGGGMGPQRPRRAASQQARTSRAAGCHGGQNCKFRALHGSKRSITVPGRSLYM